MTKEGRIEKSKGPASTKKSLKPDEKNGKMKMDAKGSKAGLEEIDSLFLEKKRAKADTVEETSKKKRHRNSKSTTENRSGSKSSRDVETRSEWVNDGMGGRFNSEGYTGRVQDGCKVFKAHVLNKPNFGKSRDCPFDCDCCFI